MADVAQSPALIVAIAMFATAAWMLYLRPRSSLHRAFALFLMVRAGFTLLWFVDPGVLSVPGRIAAYFVIATPFAALNFAYIFWKTRRPQQWHRHVLERRLVRGILLLGLLSFEVAYLLNHDLVFDVAFSEGPLSLFYSGLHAAFAAIALMFAAASRYADRPRDRAAYRLVALGFVVEPAFQSGFRLLTLANGFDPNNGLALATLAIRATTFLLVVGVLAALTTPRDGQLRAPSPNERRAVALLGTAVASGLLTYWVFMVSPFALGPRLLIILEAFWRFGLVVGTAYAVLKYQLFDIDVKVRFAIKQSTFAAIIGIIFVVTSETLELLIDASDRTIAIAIAVGLAGLFRMLQRASGMIVQQLLPAEAESRAVRRQEVYEAALEGILVDGAVTSKERLVLDALVEKLELDPEEARRLEDDVLLRLAGAA